VKCGSGPAARPMAEGSVLDIQKQCRKADVSFFFKQWGGVNKKKAGRLLKGRVFNELADLTKAMCRA
jgi:protein gp37